MDGSWHVLNGLKCMLHSHGASCAIDVLLEVFYFTLYSILNLHNTTGFNNMGQSLDDDFLVTSLIDFSHRRSTLTYTTCEMKEKVWDWLVLNCPRAFHPKGTNRAEELAEELKDTIGVRIANFCPLHSHVPVLRSSNIFILQEGGILEKCIESETTYNCYRWMKKCINCTDNPVISANEALFIELAVLDYKNCSVIPTRISETMNLFGCAYQLVAAVLVQHLHFLCIVKFGNEFLRIDNIRTKDENGAITFPSFSAALMKDPSLSSPVHFTSKEHDGVHILVYVKTDKEGKFVREQAEQDDATSWKMPRSPCQIDQPKQKYSVRLNMMGHMGPLKMTASVRDRETTTNKSHRILSYIQRMTRKTNVNKKESLLQRKLNTKMQPVR